MVAKHKLGNLVASVDRSKLEGTPSKYRQPEVVTAEDVEANVGRDIAEKS